jgi:hypothetical protein
MGCCCAQEHSSESAHSCSSLGIWQTLDVILHSASVSVVWATPTCLCCRRDDKEFKFDGASLAVLHGVTSLTMLRFEQHLAEDDDRPREQPAPPQELVAAVADLKQHNPVLKVPVGIRAPRICGHSGHSCPGWHASALCTPHMQLRIAGGFLSSLQLGVRDTG